MPVHGYDDWKTTEPQPNVELGQCDCCGLLFPLDELSFVRHDAPGNSSHSDTTICEKCSEQARIGNEQPTR